METFFENLFSVFGWLAGLGIGIVFLLLLSRAYVWAQAQMQKGGLKKESQADQNSGP